MAVCRCWRLQDVCGVVFAARPEEHNTKDRS